VAVAVAVAVAADAEDELKAKSATSAAAENLAALFTAPTAEPVASKADNKQPSAGAGGSVSLPAPMRSKPTVSGAAANRLCEIIARALVNKAIDQKSLDNVTCMIIKL
jgi:hypothetical protein